MRLDEEKSRFLATLFNLQMSGLADRFLTEIEEKVNPGMGSRPLSEIAFENRKKMQFQIVVCNGRDRNSTPNYLRLLYVLALK